MAKPCWTSSWQPTSRALALCTKTLMYRQQQWFGLIKLGTEVKLGQQQASGRPVPLPQWTRYWWPEILVRSCSSY